MMNGKTKQYQEPPQEPSHPTPRITPEMIERTFVVLENKGIIYYSEGGVYVPTAKGWQLLMKTGVVREEINAYGNLKISATNKLSMKVTKGSDVDDATIGVMANKSSADLSAEFKHALKEGKDFTVIIEVEGERMDLSGYGSPALKLNDINYITLNKTDFIDGKTVLIMSDKAAGDLDREFVEKLKNPNSKIKFIFEGK